MLHLDVLHIGWIEQVISLNSDLGSVVQPTDNGVSKPSWIGFTKEEGIFLLDPSRWIEENLPQGIVFITGNSTTGGTPVGSWFLTMSHFSVSVACNVLQMCKFHGMMQTVPNILLDSPRYLFTHSWMRCPYEQSGRCT